MVVNVGTFAKKSDGTGTQTVAHGLGVIPKALIFVTAGKATTGYSNDPFLCLGFTDGTTSYSVSSASDGAAATSNASKRRSTSPMTMVQYGEVHLFEGEFDSWDDTNFVINWTTNTASASVIGFVAIGGGGVSAKVIDWTMSTSTGSQSITGAGFTPTLAIFGYIANTGENTTNPTSSAAAGIGIGASDGTSQFATSVGAADAQGTSVTAGGFINDGVLLGGSHLAGTINWEADFTAFTSDGATLNVSNAPAATTSIGVLLLKGVDVDVVATTKSTNTTVPVAQDVTIEFNPSAVLVVGSNESASGHSTDAMLTIGGSDGTDEFCIGWTDQHAQDPTVARTFVSNTTAIELDPDFDGTSEAIADVTMGANKTTLTWSANEATALLIGVIAFGGTVGTGGGSIEGRLRGANVRPRFGRGAA